MHRSRQIRLARFHNEVEVIAHLHVTINPPAPQIHRCPDQFQPMPPILGIQENGAPLQPAPGHVIPSAGAFNPERSSHAPVFNPFPALLSTQLLNVETQPQWGYFSAVVVDAPRFGIEATVQNAERDYTTVLKEDCLAVAAADRYAHRD